MIFKEAIKKDLFRYSGKISVKCLFHHFLYSHGFRFIFFFRMVTMFKKTNIWGLLGHFFYKRYTVKYGIQIPKSVKIGKGFLIMHFGTIVINSKAVIGDNCNIYHGVTIGATFRGKNTGVPVIRNNVWIGAGAVIVGGVVIGNNVLIAPNSFVNISVPDNSVVFGNPCIVKENLDSTLNYIVNTI